MAWIRRPQLAAWVVWLGVLVAPLPVYADEPGSPVRVLVLYWGNKDFPASVAFERGFVGVLRPALGTSLEYYPEYLESDRFPGEAQATALSEYLRRKHADHHIDVVVAMSAVSLDFLNRYRRELFPYAPLIFHTNTPPLPQERLSALNMTGVVIDSAYRETVELALKLHRETERVFVISGTPEHDGRFEREARDQLYPLASRVAFEYLTDVPLDELIARVKSAPARSLVFYVRQSQDLPGRTLDVVDMLSVIAHSAAVPVYGLSRSFVERGAIGGYVINPEANGVKAGELALSVVRGARPGDIPVAVVASTPMFDWRQLQRWGVPEDRLPAGSVVLFREPGVFVRYRWYIALGLSLILAQMALIGGLLVHRARRRRSEAAWHQSEARNAAMRRAIPDLMFLQDRQGTYLDYHARDTTQLLVPPDFFLGKNMRDILPADLATTFARAFERAAETREPQEVEYTLPIEGRLKHYEARVVPCDDDSMLSIVRDVTARKELEGALQHAREDLVRLSRVTAMGELTASIAHEVNQPLSAIVANARACLNWLEAGKSSPRDENLRLALRDVMSDVNRASGVIRQTRELFSGRVERASVEVNALISETLALMRARIDVNHVSLELDLGANLDPVVVDRIQLEQVLLNLVGNALDAMHECSDRPRVLSIRSWRTTQDMCIAVRDTGKGLPDGLEDRIFSAFYTTKSDGIGMGLTISRSIIQAHGGQLLAESNADRGATFTIVLPGVTKATSGDAAMAMSAGS